jgi:apolipoprotein N-acyltransferase
MLLALGTLILLSLIFAPISFWPAVFLCMAPWLVMVGGSTLPRRVYIISFVMAAAFFLINMRWLYFATGHGYAALALYQAAYFPFVAIAVRHTVRRRAWPLAIAFPFIWTGCEMVRAVLLSGFPWFFLSHSLHSVLSLIQISDVVGAYGVTFMAAAMNGAVADVVLDRLRAGPRTWRSRVRAVWPGLAFAAGLVILLAVYGQVQLHRNTTTEGPRIAILQGDWINSVFADDATGHDKADDSEKLQTYLSMMEAAGVHKPDLFLLPETPWIMYLNPEAREFFTLSRRSFAALSERAQRQGAYIVTGSASMIPTPYDLLAKDRRYNSATLFTPEGGEPERYDKVHLVYFGEIVPFRFGAFRWLYFWLNRLMPFSGENGTFEYSLFPGESFRRFTMPSGAQGGQKFRFGVPICYEDVMPYVAREFAGARSSEKLVDFLLNISNDGWFGRGIQQPQHLAICVFRAVENRVGIARAVNTGVSAFIRPDGRIHDVVRGELEERWPGACGYSVANVGVDSRFTLYTRFGDWFGWMCALVWLLIFLDYWVARARELAD